MADNNIRGRERDLILAPNEFAYILDETKGNVINYVGPHKTSLANTDQPVTFNHKTKRFMRCNLEEATFSFTIAPEGWYVMLKNPAKDGNPARTGAANNLPDLNIGRKINIPGPVAFAPWPGQMARVIQGHRLRSNQYLIVRVYDEEAARANWGKAVIKPQAQDKPAAESSESSPEAADFTIGQLLLIKGTEVSFYIPPTGVEVVPEEANNYVRLAETLERLEHCAVEYVRSAVTLEQLEYCTLLDENGSKRYIRGPAVVFPKPTEQFVEKHGARKFKAIELNEISGLYIKVIAPYEDGGKAYKTGDELFITGKDQMIYFPRPEHAIVRYGDSEVMYAVAIPAGEARYVLNRLSGQIMLKRGPAVFLPDPRSEVIVRRIIEPKLAALWFPGNQEVLEYNRRLLEKARREREEAEEDSSFYGDSLGAEEAGIAPAPAAMQVRGLPREPTGKGYVGDEFDRGKKYTPPRTVTLDTKYEGAVAINVWTGYAVLIVGKSGERKVFSGPGTYLLEYDEILEAVTLSTGTPKSDQKLERTVYLRVLHNKVSDLVEAETADLCQVKIHLSYRVNFEGDSEKWFRVENYVKFLTEHMRSLLRNAVRHHGVEAFYANAIAIVRDTILGASDDERKRPGRLFSENGMRIYDVEVLNVSIGNDEIAGLLIDAQHETVQKALELNAERKNLEVMQEKENFRRQLAQAQAATQQLMLGLQQAEIQEKQKVTLAELEAKAQAQGKELDTKLAEQTALGNINKAELARDKARQELELHISQQSLQQYLEKLRADVDAVVNKAGAVSPQLIAALQAFGDQALAQKMAESMAPLAILGGNSVAEVFSQLLKGTVLEGVLQKRIGEEGRGGKA
jgi:major vault protein